MWYEHAPYLPESSSIHHPSPSLHHIHFTEVITLTVFVAASVS
jgi:hypothetical protein